MTCQLPVTPAYNHRLNVHFLIACFQVVNSAGFSSSIERFVTVVGVCPTGRVLCEAGICAESESQCSLFSSASDTTADEDAQETVPDDRDQLILWIGLRAVFGIGEAALCRVLAFASCLACFNGRCSYL